MAEIPLRRRLFLLTAAGLVPLVVMAGLGLFVIHEQQYVEARQVGLELARSVANSVDAELDGSISVLEALATTPVLDSHDLRGFLERTRRVTESRTEWAAIVLADKSGRPLVHTRVADGRAEMLEGDRASFDRVLQTQAPAVGSLTRDSQGNWFLAVRAPVLRGKQLKYVVSAVVTPEAIHRVLTRQQLPEGWVISVLDAHGLRVARSRAHQENLGGQLSESAQRVVDTGGRTEGFGVAYTLEGERIFAAYSRLDSSDWLVVLGMPTAGVDAVVWGSLVVYGSGILLSLGLGTLISFRVARGITHPIADLRAAAEALGRRQTPQLPQTTILEIGAVGAALKQAAEELTKAEAERDDLFRKEREAREAAEAADRSKEEFMTVLSHELRTPLNAVYGWARMLQSGELRDETMIARAKDAIIRNAHAQVRLIDDLLDLSRISTGKMRLDVRRVEMAGVLQGALDAVRPAADAKMIRLHTSIDPGAGFVTGDPARLQQVVWNLLMNAVKFTPSGGEVRLRLERVNSSAQISVSDTGQGIAPAMLPHVFERFRQADSSSTRAHGGLGLGLALVKHLVQLHGGNVVAHSDGEGKGATFTVTLPMTPSALPAVSPHDQPSAPSVDEQPKIVRLDGLRVLVADDDPESVALVDTVLSGAGADVRTCLSAASAFDMLRRWRPDVIVSDIEMPGEDGYRLIHRIRALAPRDGGETPAIALTAYGRPQDRLRALDSGFNMHVPKPVEPGELTAIVADLVGQVEPHSTRHRTR
jgi:signal transduction histidine kinase/ActR/RegA family two-component response regulator